MDFLETPRPEEDTSASCVLSLYFYSGLLYFVTLVFFAKSSKKAAKMANRYNILYIITIIVIIESGALIQNQEEVRLCAF